jgi:hypothetical protein
MGFEDGKINKDLFDDSCFEYGYLDQFWLCKSCA